MSPAESTPAAAEASTPLDASSSGSAPLRFSLGYLMGGVTLITVAIGLIARDYHGAAQTAYRERQVAVAWSKKGASAQFHRNRVAAGLWQYYPRDFLDRVSELRFFRFRRAAGPMTLGSPLERDSLFAQAAELQELERINFAHTDFGDDDIDRLRSLPHLTSLSLRGTRVTDRGLIKLAELNQLTRIELNHTNVTEAGVRHLLEMPNLTLLDLRNTGVVQLDVFREYQGESDLNLFVSLYPATNIHEADLQDFTAKHPRIHFIQVR